MAKYRLTKNPNKSVNCEILHENLNGYIVRFDNGMIKNVNKKNVYALDRIDEAVLDDIRAGVSKFGRRVADVGRRIYNKIKGFVVNVLNLKGVVVFTDENDKVIKASHPINAIAAAKAYDGINFIPSATTIRSCEEVGIEPEAVENYRFEGGYTGSYQGISVMESVNGHSLIDSILLEATYNKHDGEDDDYIRLEGNKYGLVDFDAVEIADYLTNMYEAQFNGVLAKKATTAVPVVYGAPGIGKSAIIEGLKRNVSELGLVDELGNDIDINIITVNANNVNSETFTMPATFHKEIREEKDDIHDVITVIKDLPKSWLPMYDYLENDDTEVTYDDYTEDGDAVRNGGDVMTKRIVQNAIANGGGFKVDEKTGQTVLVNGPGGVFFIDEFSRMTQFGKDSLMTIATSRTIGQGLKFGDRWVICAAANRPEDMSDAANEKGFQAELADRTRFAIMNFVPDPKDWYMWAEAENETGRTNVIPEIIKFIKSSQKTKGDYGYFYDAYNFGNDEMGMARGDKAACVPRTWEASSNALVVNFLMRKSPNITLTEYVSSLPPKEIENALKKIEKIVATNIGTEPAKQFGLFMRTQCEGLKPDVAKELWFNGLSTTKKPAKDYIDNVISKQSPMDWTEFLNETYLPMLTGSLVTKPTQDGLINILDLTMYVIKNYVNSSQNAAEMSTILKSAYASIQSAFNINLDSHNNEWAKVSQHYLNLKNSL